jgi:hypothetical protein
MAMRAQITQLTLPVSPRQLAAARALASSPRFYTQTPPNRSRFDSEPRSVPLYKYCNGCACNSDMAAQFPRLSEKQLSCRKKAWKAEVESSFNGATGSLITLIEPEILSGCPTWIRTMNNASKGRCVTITPSDNPRIH